jgi:hypothetical protein
MKKESFSFFFVIIVLVVFSFNLNPASALELANAEDETYAMQINELDCELTDYEINLDLWHLSITGCYTVTFNNSGDIDMSIRWNEPINDTSQEEEKELIVPQNTVKRYSVNFSFNLLSRDFSYEYSEIY